eukprot:gene17904-5637_t
MPPKPGSPKAAPKPGAKPGPKAAPKPGGKGGDAGSPKAAPKPGAKAGAPKPDPKAAAAKPAASPLSDDDKYQAAKAKMKLLYIRGLPDADPKPVNEKDPKCALDKLAKKLASDAPDKVYTS